MVEFQQKFIIYIFEKYLIYTFDFLQCQEYFRLDTSLFYLICARRIFQNFQRANHVEINVIR